MKEIAVIAELFDGRIQPVTWELVSAGRRIAAFSGRSDRDIVLVIPSDSPGRHAGEAAEKAGCRVAALEIPGCHAYVSRIYIKALGQYLADRNISHVLAGHTSQGRDFAPGLSVRLGAHAIAGVSDIRSENGALIYVRPAFNSEKQLCIRAAAGCPVLMTVLSGHFEGIADAGEAGEIETRAMDPLPSEQVGIVHQGIRKIKVGNQALKAADVVVSAGRGIGSRENLETVEQFCCCLPQSALGASRPLVDQGWIGYEHQVGITGAAVAPELYIACGISGSSQHIAGMQQSKRVVAVNRSMDAPIFRHADVCIVEDVIPFLKEVTRVLTGDDD